MNKVLFEFEIMGEMIREERIALFAELIKTTTTFCFCKNVKFIEDGNVLIFNEQTAKEQNLEPMTTEDIEQFFLDAFEKLKLMREQDHD